MKSFVTALTLIVCVCARTFAQTVPAANESRLSGRVVTSTNEPQPAEIHLYEVGARDGHEEVYSRCNTYTDDEGNFSCKHLPPGKYYVQALPLKVIPREGRPSGTQAIGTFFYPSATDFSKAELITVTAEREGWCDMKFVQPKTFSIAGILGKIPKGTPIRLLAANGKTRLESGVQIFSRLTENIFEATAVPSGNYVISADWLDNGVRHHAETDLHVDQHDVKGLTLQESTFVRVDGTLTEPAGVKITDVALYGLDDSIQRVDASVHQGKFSFSSVPAGTYYIGLPISHGAYVSSVVVDGKNIPYDRVVVADGKTSTSVAVNIDQTNTAIRGALRDWKDSDSPVQAVLVSSDSGQVFTVPASKDGTFTFRGVRPGAYTLFAWQQSANAIYRDPKFLMSHRQDATDLSLDDGETTTTDVPVLTR